MQRLERPELLGDHERRVVREHDPSRPDTDRRGRIREVCDHDRRRCAGDPVQVVVLGDPVPLVAESLGVAHEVDRVAKRLRRSPALDDRCEVEDRERRHPSKVPT
jgi:hypothetical protein